MKDSQDCKKNRQPEQRSAETSDVWDGKNRRPQPPSLHKDQQLDSSEKFQQHNGTKMNNCIKREGGTASFVCITSLPQTGKGTVQL